MGDRERSDGSLGEYEGDDRVVGTVKMVEESQNRELRGDVSAPSGALDERPGFERTAGEDGAVAPVGLVE